MIRHSGPEGDPGAPVPTASAASPLRSLAHELNSSLDGALRWLGLVERALDMNDDDRATARAGIEAVRLGLNEMSDRLRRVMDGGASDLGLHWGHRSLVDEMRWQMERMEPRAAAAAIDLAARCDPTVADMPAGPIGTIMLNGLRNAIASCTQAGPSPHRIEVGLRRDGGDVVLEIADTGRGIDGAVTPRGYGVGLAVSTRIAEALGGTLRLESRDDRRGARLVVGIPVDGLRSSPPADPGAST